MRIVLEEKGRDSYRTPGIDSLALTLRCLSFVRDLGDRGWTPWILLVDLFGTFVGFVTFPKHIVACLLRRSWWCGRCRRVALVVLLPLCTFLETLVFHEEFDRFATLVVFSDCYRALVLLKILPFSAFLSLSS